MIVGVVVLIFGLICLFFSFYLTFILGIIGLIIIIYGYDKGISWKKGLNGENLVADYLNSLSKENFVFNEVNLPNSRGNIDHIVIGPKGIFAIETKNLTGSFVVDDDVWLVET